MSTQSHYSSFAVLRLCMISSILSFGQGLAPLSSPPPSIYKTLQAQWVLNPKDGRECSALDGLGSHALVIILPQLGDFDTAEYCEQIVACEHELTEAGLDWRVISIGNEASATRFSSFTGVPLERLRVCTDARVHKVLDLSNGPNWDIPDFIPATIFGLSTRAWLNYMSMCAGVAAPGTLREILRGYTGDRSAPERLSLSSKVVAGPVIITGTRRVQMFGGLIDYENAWKEEHGYQRPLELATVRLRNMVEVLSNWKVYVPDDKFLAWRGATFLFNGENLEYEYRTPGVLTYSATPSRPLSFLEPKIGEKALNPLGLGDSLSSGHSTLDN